MGPTAGNTKGYAPGSPLLDAAGAAGVASSAAEALAAGHDEPRRGERDPHQQLGDADPEQAFLAVGQAQAEAAAGEVGAANAECFDAPVGDGGRHAGEILRAEHGE